MIASLLQKISTRCPLTEDSTRPEIILSHNCAYVQLHYQVPAEVGRRVIAFGKPGIILSDRGHYIRVVLEEDPKKRIDNYHPIHEVQHGEMAESLSAEVEAGHYR